MKNIVRKIYLLVFAAIGFLLFSCAELIDCIASARPDIHPKSLATGTVGNSYNDYIDSDVTNDPNDNAYEYYFSVTGNIPIGMTYHQQGRKIYFTGIPSQAGSYTFRVRLTVNPPDSYGSNYGYYQSGNRICLDDDTTTKEFTIVIQ